jgi:hypothetical protein
VLKVAHGAAELALDPADVAHEGLGARVEDQ